MYLGQFYDIDESEVAALGESVEVLDAPPAPAAVAPEQESPRRRRRTRKTE